ncbi:MAG TPA: nitroreductase family protein [Propionibacteriaceae bacterium]|nr:nitroreductase family protein [Propionibacteriaceae bacterium]
MPTLPLSPDELLTTTRSVRKRLDLTRPVPLDLVRECLEIALQAPSGSNRQGWQWMVITEENLRREIGDYTAGRLRRTSSRRAPPRHSSPTIRSATQFSNA